jgi:hypothetical protein
MRNFDAVRACMSRVCECLGVPLIEVRTQQRAPTYELLFGVVSAWIAPMRMCVCVYACMCTSVRTYACVEQMLNEHEFYLYAA